MIHCSHTIRSVRWDRNYVLAPAIVGAALAMVCVAFRSVIPLVVALWLALGDGPHMAAAWARTYTDPQTRAERPWLLWGSIVLALAPVLIVFVAHATDRAWLWDGTLALLGIASVWHVARQHWGFVAIYRWRAQEYDKGSKIADQTVIRAASYLPWLYALTMYPPLRTLTQRAASPSALEKTFALALVVIWCAILLLYAVHLRLRYRSLSALTIKHAYIALVVLAHSAAYFLLAPHEPLWKGAQTMDAALAVVTVWLSTFHAIEYVALCHYYLQQGDKAHVVAGAASTLARRPGLYLAAVLGFGTLVYVGMGMSTGVFPSVNLLPTTTLGGVPVARVVLALFWSIAIHHYVIDMQIWRVGSDKRLRVALDRSE